MIKINVGTHRLRKHVSPIVPCSQKLQHSIATCHILIDVLILDSDMLGPLVEHRIGRDSYGSLVVRENSTRIPILNKRNMRTIHNTSTIVRILNARSLDHKLSLGTDCATFVRRLEYQVIGPLPMNVT